MFSKGMVKKGGRKAGTPNKLSRAFREAVMIVYDAVGGDEAFARWAVKNRSEFYKIASRLIPAEMGRHQDEDKIVVIVNRAGGDREPLTIEGPSTTPGGIETVREQP
jgi:hypothetical protein